MSVGLFLMNQFSYFSFFRHFFAKFKFKSALLSVSDVLPNLLRAQLGKLSNRKSSQTWELVQIGGVVKKSKKSQVSVEKSSKLGGGPHISKKSQVSEGTKD